MKMIDEEGHKYLGTLEFDKVKEKEMKTEFVREYKRRIRLTLISKLNRKNKKIKAINSWVVAIKRYGVGVLAWRVDELGWGRFQTARVSGRNLFLEFWWGEQKKAGFQCFGIIQ